jgi:hypothetical protein
LEGFAAHEARQHEPYEVKSWTEEFPVYPASDKSKGRNVEAAGASTREWIAKVEADGVNQ